MWWWIGVTVPLSAAATFLYIAHEWLFFLTNLSMLSLAPLRERILALTMTAAPWLDELIIAQLIATAVAVLVPRLRAVAVIPAAVMLSCLLLLMADNFTYTLLGFSSIRSAPAARFVYLALFLAAAAGCTVTLFRALSRRFEGAPGRTLAAVWILALPPIVAAVAAALNAQATPPPIKTTGPRPNVLILSADGVEARRTSVYGYDVATTPFLESIRDQTLFCDNAFANGGSTLASLVSMFTSKLPTTTHVAFAPMGLSEDIAEEHLPGLLRRRGYRSLQLTVRHYADALEANLKGSFDLANYRWENRLADGDEPQGGIGAFGVEVTERLEQRLLYLSGLADAPENFADTNAGGVRLYWGDERRVDALRDFIGTNPEPWLAHVHLTDSHYNTPAPRQPFGRDKYDAKLKRVDASIAKIIADLKLRGQLDRTIIVITSDHAIRWTTDERIPLLIRFPHGAHARREGSNVQLLDVAPTILDYMQVPVPSWMEGVSLLRPEKLDPQRPVFSIFEVKAVRQGGWWVAASPEPPNYGIQQAAVAIGSQWLKVHLETGVTKANDIDGHTDPRPDPQFEEKARRVLFDKLTAAGFRVGPAR